MKFKNKKYYRVTDSNVLKTFYESIDFSRVAKELQKESTSYDKKTIKKNYITIDDKIQIQYGDSTKLNWQVNYSNFINVYFNLQSYLNEEDKLKYQNVKFLDIQIPIVGEYNYDKESQRKVGEIQNIANLVQRDEFNPQMTIIKESQASAIYLQKIFDKIYEIVEFEILAPYKEQFPPKSSKSKKNTEVLINEKKLYVPIISRKEEDEDNENYSKQFLQKTLEDGTILTINQQKDKDEDIIMRKINLVFQKLNSSVDKKVVPLQPDSKELIEANKNAVFTNMNLYIKKYSDMINCYKFIEGSKKKSSSENGRKKFVEGLAKKYDINLTYEEIKHQAQIYNMKQKLLAKIGNPEDNQKQHFENYLSENLQFRQIDKLPFQVADITTQIYYYVICENNLFIDGMPFYKQIVSTPELIYLFSERSKYSKTQFWCSPQFRFGLRDSQFIKTADQMDKSKSTCITFETKMIVKQFDNPQNILTADYEEQELKDEIDITADLNKEFVEDNENSECREDSLGPACEDS